MKRRTLFSRLLATHLLVAVGALGVLGVAVDRLLAQRTLERLRDRLAAEARTVEASMERSDPARLQAFVGELGRAAGTRLTVIRADGVVLADSEQDPARMENHASRPEVARALRGAVGSDQRTSESVGRPLLYVALPVRDGIVVRAALAATEAAEQRNEVRRAVILTFLAVAAVAAGVSALIARNLARPLSHISDEVRRVARGEFARVEPTGPREARSLADAVNSMAAQLAERVGNLRHETALREQILSTMEDAVLLAGTSGDIVYANPAAARLMGSQSATLPAQVRQPGTAEFAVHHPRRRELRSATVRLSEGRLLTVVRDVTDAKRIEAVRRDFVANASHELKTPSAAILATAETIAQAARTDPERVPGFAATLVREAARLSRLVEDLLDLSRLEDRAIEPPRTPVPFGLVVTREAARAELAAGERGLSLRTDIDDVTVQGVEEDLALLVRNLIDNAIRYTERGGVNIRLQRTDGRAVLEVSDTGIGIPSSDLPRIFERFYRVDKARSRETGGTGLGLAIARHVAESHGGRIGAESELGRGSRFVVELPGT